MALASIVSIAIFYVSVVVCTPQTESNIKYVELNQELVPKEISNIQNYDPGNKKCTRQWRTPFGKNISRYEKKSSGVLIQEYVRLLKEKNTDEDRPDYYEEDDYNPSSSTPAPDAGGINETEILSKDLEKIIGTDVPNVYFDEDWGFFSSVLASYNNHWALSTGPEDWWTVVLRNVAQAVADHGDIPAVRNLFVAHQGKKEININVGPSLSGINYSWLFNQFSAAIRDNIKTEGYVETIENSFSTTTSDLKIISQVMLMSSLKKYFSYGFHTACGIPGLHMKGTPEDWEKLNTKFIELEKILEPVKKELRLKRWFDDTRIVFTNLNKTFNENPVDPEVIQWWSRILSWKEDYGSGVHPHWEGWFPNFLGANSHQPYQADDFPSGLVYTAVTITDGNTPPPVKDTGIFVAGTLGFTVKQNGNTHPIVEPNQIWNLLLPKGSPIKSRLLGHTPRSDVSGEPV